MASSMKCPPSIKDGWIAIDRFGPRWFQDRPEWNDGIQIWHKGGFTNHLKHINLKYPLHSAWHYKDACWEVTR